MSLFPCREVRTDRNDTHCGNNMYCSQLNVAEPGATNRGMAGQAETLIAKLRDDNSTEGDVDFDNDWKVITMFIGGNDLCRICENFVSTVTLSCCATLKKNPDK